MKPSDKSPEIEQFITNVFGVDRAGSIKDNICCSCSKRVDEQQFRNQLSLKEYTISGLCQQCQDEVFGID